MKKQIYAIFAFFILSVVCNAKELTCRPYDGSFVDYQLKITGDISRVGSGTLSNLNLVVSDPSGSSTFTLKYIYTSDDAMYSYYTYDDSDIPHGTFDFSSNTIQVAGNNYVYFDWRDSESRETFSIHCE